MVQLHPQRYILFSGKQGSGIWTDLSIYSHSLMCSITYSIWAAHNPDSEYHWFHQSNDPLVCTSPSMGRKCRNLREMGSRCRHTALKVLSRHAWTEPVVSTHYKGDKSSTFISHASGTLPFECIWYWHVPVHLISSPGSSQPSFPIHSTCPWAWTSALVNGCSTLMQPLWLSIFTSLAFLYHVYCCHSISKCSWCSLTLSNWYDHLSSSSHMVESLDSAPPALVWLQTIRYACLWAGNVICTSTFSLPRFSYVHIRFPQLSHCILLPLHLLRHSSVKTQSVRGPWVTEDQGDCNGGIHQMKAKVRAEPPQGGFLRLPFSGGNWFPCWACAFRSIWLSLPDFRLSII